MGVAGASRFLGAATLANTQGIAAQQPSLLGQGGSATSLLDVGRANSVSGVGLSSNARALNNQFLESSSSTFNQIFSLGIGATASIEGLQQQILALRAGIPDSQLAPSLRQDTGEVAAAETGQQIDVEA